MVRLVVKLIPRVVALAMVLAVAWGSVAPALHAAEDGHAPGAVSAAAFDAACPPDCPDPGHRHAGHDHSTCPTCQSAGRPALREQRVAISPPAGLRFDDASEPALSPSRPLVLSRPARGPPSR